MRRREFMAILEVDQVFQDLSRAEALANAWALASQRAEDAGADPATIALIEAEDSPIAYPPGNALRVQVKAVGDISRQRSVDDARDLRS
jgi:hypothetical protein